MPTFSRFLLLLFIIEILTVGCTPNKTEVSTVTPALTQTKTVIPSSTPTNTVMPSPIAPTAFAITNTPTLFSIPTLSADEAPDHLLELIKSNGNCLLPCWIGFVPGISSNDTIFSILSPYSSIATNYYLPISDPRGIDFILQKDKFHIDLKITLRPVGIDETRKMVRVKIKQIMGHSYSPYSDIFKQYSLQNILKVYGKPSAVELVADLHKYDPTSGTSFETYISYPEKGIYIRYTTMADEISGDRVRSCPSEASIDLWLTIPDVNNENMKLLTDMNREWGYSRTSLQDATQMSIDQFFESFKSQPDQCLITPKSIWPH
jgi:hypothetical protein